MLAVMRHGIPCEREDARTCRFRSPESAQVDLQLLLLYFSIRNAVVLPLALPVGILQWLDIYREKHSK